MQAEAVRVVKVLVFNFSLIQLDFKTSFDSRGESKKNPLFRGISAVRFGKGSVRFDTNIKIKKHWKDCFSNNNSSDFLIRVINKKRYKIIVANTLIL